MTSCHDMKVGQVYVCGDCGLELQVIKECEECDETESACGCVEECTFECCGERLTLKQG